jgi:hypothetical protein
MLDLPEPTIPATSVNTYGCTKIDDQMRTANRLLGLNLRVRCRVVDRHELPTHLRLEEWRPQETSLNIVLPLSIHKGPGPLDGSAGACYGSTLAVSINDAKPDTLAHEIGHFSGLDHVSDPDNVMGPFRNNNATFTRHQLENIWSHLEP